MILYHLSVTNAPHIQSLTYLIQAVYEPCPSRYFVFSINAKTQKVSALTSQNTAIEIAYFSFTTKETISDLHNHIRQIHSITHKMLTNILTIFPGPTSTDGQLQNKTLLHEFYNYDIAQQMSSKGICHIVSKLFHFLFPV